MDPFVAEIRIFPFNQFSPKGWAFCDGQLLAISQNTALFSLLGTTYGGDGKSTFQLPNMQGRVPMHPGNGAGLTPRFLGEEDGTEGVTLLQTEIPLHSHGVVSVAGNFPANTHDPTSNASGKSSQGNVYAPPPASGQPLASQTIGVVGNNFPHNNMQPYLTLSFS